jgi:hypothetical protein
MEAVRLTSKEDLRGLRGLLNLLRSVSEEPEPTSPAPRLPQVGDLLDITAKAGLPVELRVLGERRDLPPAVELAGYRIVQEALTNTLRHAGPARATVVLSYDVASLGWAPGPGRAAVALGRATRPEQRPPGSQACSCRCTLGAVTGRRARQAGSGRATGVCGVRRGCAGL